MEGGDKLIGFFVNRNDRHSFGHGQSGSDAEPAEASSRQGGSRAKRGGRGLASAPSPARSVCDKRNLVATGPAPRAIISGPRASPPPKTGAAVVQRVLEPILRLPGGPAVFARRPVPAPVHFRIAEKVSYILQRCEFFFDRPAHARGRRWRDGFSWSFDHAPPGRHGRRGGVRYPGLLDRSPALSLIDQTEIDPEDGDCDVRWRQHVVLFDAEVYRETRCRAGSGSRTRTGRRQTALPGAVRLLSDLLFTTKAAVLPGKPRSGTNRAGSMRDASARGIAARATGTLATNRVPLLLFVLYIYGNDTRRNHVSGRESAPAIQTAGQTAVRTAGRQQGDCCSHPDPRAFALLESPAPEPVPRLRRAGELHGRAPGLQLLGYSSAARVWYVTVTAVRAVPPGASLPMDTNIDRRHDHVNGNRRMDFADVVWLFNHLYRPRLSLFPVGSPSFGPTASAADPPGYF